MSNELTLPIRDYETFDPLRETTDHINMCLCGTFLGKEHVVYGAPLPEQLGLAANAQVHIRRFFVQCPTCGSKGPATKLSIYAVLQWNISTLCIKPSYRTVPLFGLHNMPRHEAVIKMQAVRNDLKQRLLDCTERLNDADVSKHPGPRYHAKLGAYQAWNYYALHLLSDNDSFSCNPNGVAGQVQNAGT